MKKLILITLILICAFNVFSSEVNSQITKTKYSSPISFTKYLNLNQGTDSKITPYSSNFKSFLVQNQQNLFIAGLALTFACIGSLLIAIPGTVLLGLIASKKLEGTIDEKTALNIWVSGLILTGIGWGLFGIFLLIAIPVWILYGLSFSKKDFSMEIVNNGIAFVKRF